MNYSIDLRSDTVTLPSLEMRKAIARAEVGDDVYGEDPTVRELESLGADMLGKQASLFVPSGTMANLLSILGHCTDRKRLLVGDKSDIWLWEAGGASILGGLFYHPLETQENGEISIDAMETALYDDHDFQCVPAGLICLEDTHCLSGGTVLSLDYLEQVYEFAQRKGLPVHLDGARLLNAAAAMNVDVRQITWIADSVSLCLSKSLGAPVGSLVAGRAPFIHHLRRLRKMIGGGMRQAGILAAAGIYALEHMVDRLVEDHVHARMLAEGLAQIPGIHVERAPETNIVFWTLSNPEASLKSFIYALENEGVRVLELGKGRIRAVTHYGITAQEIHFAIDAVRKALARSCDASSRFDAISQALTNYDNVEYSLALAGAADGLVGR